MDPLQARPADALLTPAQGRDAALAAHFARPLSIAAFADADLNFKLFPRQADFLRKCFPAPQRRSDPIFNPDVREAVALWGKGSGKDTVSSIAHLYVVYRLMLLDNPQAALGLSSVAPNIDLINVASEAKQAKTIYFEYVKAMLRQSAFFTLLLPSFKEWVPERDILSDHIRFPHSVFAHSLHSQARAAEGKNTLFAVMDEADAFTDSEEHENAAEVHDTLLSSMNSRFPRHHLLLVISYPRHLESFTIRRYEAGAKGKQRVLPDRGSTWDIRPDRTRDDFADDYERNPEDARAKYECLPPATVDAFFTMPEKLDAAFHGEPLVTWEPTVTEVLGQQYRTVNLISTRPPNPKHRYWLHGDAGLVSDSFGLALARAEGPGRVVDALIEWRPAPGMPVLLQDVERVIHALRDAGFRLLGCSFDRWNSAESIQRLGAAGIYAEAMTFSNPEQLQMFNHLKTLAYTEVLTLPREGPAVERLRRELRRLQLLRGSKVDHPSGESKDLADAVAAACWRAYEPDVVGLKPGEVAHQQHTTEALQVLGAGGFNADLLRKPW